MYSFSFIRNADGYQHTEMATGHWILNHHIPYKRKLSGIYIYIYINIYNIYITWIWLPSKEMIFFVQCHQNNSNNACLDGRSGKFVELEGSCTAFGGFTEWNWEHGNYIGFRVPIYSVFCQHWWQADWRDAIEKEQKRETLSSRMSQGFPVAAPPWRQMMCSTCLAVKKSNSFTKGMHNTCSHQLIALLF